MAGRIELARPGEAAEDLLAAAIDTAQAGDRLAPVWVVVRTPVVALDLRRRLAGRRALGGARFSPITRLIELLGAPGLSGPAGEHRPLSDAGLRAAIRVALRSGAGVLDAVADHPSAEDSLARVYRTLRAVPLADQDRIATVSRRAGDVVGLAQRVRSHLAPRYYDISDLSAAAAEAVLDGSAEVEEIGTVILHLPDPSVSAHLELLAALSDRTDVVALLGETGDPAADRGLLRLVEELNGAGFSQSPARGVLLAGGSPCFGRAIGAPDMEEEARLAVRLLMAHVEAGGQLGRCAVAYPSASRAARSYRSLLNEQFGLAGVPFSRPVGHSLAEETEARLITAFVDLVTAEEHRFERGAVIALLAAGITPRSSIAAGLATLDGRTNLPIGAFDRCSRAAGVVAEVEEWDRRLAAYGRRALERWTSGAPGPVAEDLRRLVRRLAEHGARLDALGSWTEVAAWLADVAAALIEPSERQVEVGERLSALAELSELEPLAPARTGERARQVQSAVASALDRTAGPEGRFGVGPVVGTIRELAGIRTDLLLVLGLSEGVVPARTPEDPLVTEIERQASRVLTELERTEDRDRRTLLWLLGGAGDAVALFSRVDRNASRIAYRSRWLLGDLFHGEATDVPSYSGALARVARGRLVPADTTDLEMAALQQAMAAGVPPRRLFVAALGDLRERYRSERDRDEPLSRFAGSIGVIGGDDAVFGQVMSATSMQSLAACPLQFLFERLLRVGVLEAPERRHTIEARDKGLLIHGVLEAFVGETVLGEGGGFSGWGADDFSRLHELAVQACAEYEERGLTGKAVFWQTERAQIVRDLDRYIRVDNAWLAEGNETPIAVEMSFGMREQDPVVIRAGDRQIHFRGTIDRIDKAADGSLRIIDYKSGRADSYNSIKTDPLGGGRHLQLPIYAKAAEPLRTGQETVTAEYRFCSAIGGFSRVQVELTGALEEELGGVLTVLAQTVANGTLPPRPGRNDDHCRYCDFEAACRLDRGDAWRRAAATAPMSAYVALVEREAKSE
jgi:RecB family exonuclease